MSFFKDIMSKFITNLIEINTLESICALSLVIDRYKKYEKLLTGLKNKEVTSSLENFGFINNP
jgi:hypothetical protein